MDQMFVKSHGAQGHAEAKCISIYKGKYSRSEHTFSLCSSCIFSSLMPTGSVTAAIPQLRIVSNRRYNTIMYLHQIV